MYHEARQQEKKVRSMIVDYRKRSARRRLHLQKIAGDPNNQTRAYGIRAKIHIDPAISSGADEKKIMMPWQGDKNNMIDRFDVRTHLDFIPELQGNVDHFEKEDSMIVYERFRILIYNHFHRVDMDNFFSKIHKADKKADKYRLNLSSRLYENDHSDVSSHANIPPPQMPPLPEDSGSESSISDTDEKIDKCDFQSILAVVRQEDIKVLNEITIQYGLTFEEFTSCIREEMRKKAELAEWRKDVDMKMQLSGRDCRRKRMLFKEKRRAERGLSPLAYIVKETCKEIPDVEEESDEYTEKPGKIEYITSFGNEPKRDESKQRRKRRSFTRTKRSESPKYRHRDKCSSSRKSKTTTKHRSDDPKPESLIKALSIPKPQEPSLTGSSSEEAPVKSYRREIVSSSSDSFDFNELKNKPNKREKIDTIVITPKSNFDIRKALNKKMKKSISNIYSKELQAKKEKQIRHHHAQKKREEDIHDRFMEMRNKNRHDNEIKIENKIEFGSTRFTQSRKSRFDTDSP